MQPLKAASQTKLKKPKTNHSSSSSHVVVLSLCVTLVASSSLMTAVVCICPQSRSSAARDDDDEEEKVESHLSDVLHVCPGVLLQQKELVPHPPSFRASQRHSVGILSRQSRPPPPPCSPSQGPEPVAWRAEVGHGPQHHKYANFPSIHGHTTTTTPFSLRPPLSGLCPECGQSVGSVLML